MQFEGLLFQEVRSPSLNQPSLVGATEVYKLLNTVNIVPLHLGELVYHNFVEATRAGLELLFHSVECFHAKS